MITRKIIIGFLITVTLILLGFILFSYQKSPTSESGITFEEDKKILPFPPNILEVIKTVDGVQITWPALTSDRIGEYHVYRRANNFENWELVATVPVKPSVATYSYLDTASSMFEYAVSSVTIYGTEGPKGPIATPKP